MQNDFLIVTLKNHFYHEKFIGLHQIQLGPKFIGHEFVLWLIK